MDTVVIHREPRIDWQNRAAERFHDGLKAIGINSYITASRCRMADIAIVLGTTCWKPVEESGRYLLVDRASWGDPHYVQLVWDGHGRRGDHKVPKLGGRKLDIDLQPWDDSGHKVVLCGQTETWSPQYTDVKQWYAEVKATHFRKHPAGENPTGLPLAQDWFDVGKVITLNSSVGVESVLNGIPTVAMDEASMAWDVAAHDPQETVIPCRDEWLEWLAWTQWHWDEIAEGKPIRHLFEEL